ncbi:MAG: hypothetical protein U0903_00845 [Planctomycetales bacterium]
MNPALLKLLRCPQTRTELVLEGDSLVNTDPETRLQYPVNQMIPVLIPAQAITLSPEEWQRVMRAHTTPSCAAP